MLVLIIRVKVHFLKDLTRLVFGIGSDNDPLLSKIIVSWTGWSCIEALWRCSGRAFQDEVGVFGLRGLRNAVQIEEFELVGWRFGRSIKGPINPLP